MAETDWNAHLSYLMQTRALYVNDDYLEFLVKQVWKLTAPVNVIDFGCGYGYMGLKLLPLLAQGSAYTGLDKEERLLAMGRDLFAQMPYRHRFVEGDAMTVQLADGLYDAAICHAFLLHMPDPVAVLKRMKACVRPGGLVLCIEPHWIGAMAGTHYHGARQTEFVKLGPLQRLYEMGADVTGKDGNIGIKLPAYLAEIGLTHIDCRVSDRVNVLSPHEDRELQERLFQSMSAEGLGAVPGERLAVTERLVARGLSAEEAAQQYDAEYALAQRYGRYGANQHAVYAPGMMISYGRVPSADA